MSEEASNRFEALQEAALALLAACNEDRPSESRLRDALRTLHQRKQAVERMWQHVSEEELRGCEDAMDRAESRALKMLKIINPYIHNTEDARDRRIPQYSPMATRSKKKKSGPGDKEDEEPRPSTSGTQGSNGTEAGTIDRDETDYESAGEVAVVQSGTTETSGQNGNGTNGAEDDAVFLDNVSGKANTDRIPRSFFDASDRDQRARPEASSERSSNSNNASNNSRDKNQQTQPEAGSEPPRSSNDPSDNSRNRETEPGRDRSLDRARQGGKGESSSRRERSKRDRSRSSEKSNRPISNRDRNTDRSRSRHRDKGKRKDRSRSRHKQRSRSRTRSRDRNRKKHRSRSRTRSKNGRKSRDRTRSKGRKGNSRSRSRSGKNRHRDRNPGHDLAGGRSPDGSNRYQDRSYQNYQNKYHQSYRNKYYKSDRDRYYKDNYYKDNYSKRDEPVQRDRAHSWGQHYYPKENRKFVPPSSDSRFGDLDFPDSWALPSAADFRRYFTIVDVLPLLGKPNAFGCFNGTVDAYPGWQENFYRIVHVQAVPLIHKVNALDQAVSNEVKSKLFRDLGSSAEDYLLRVRRLEEEYGGSGRHLSKMIKRMKAVGEIGKNYEKVRDAAYALERFICSNLCRDREDPFYGEIIKDHLRSDVKQEYNAYVHDNRLKDNAVTILEFLKRAVRVKRTDDQPSKHKFHKKHAKKKKDSVKEKDKVGSKNAEAKANYQFFRSPSTDSSADETSSSDTDSCSEGSSTDDTGNCNWQTKNEICDFCEGLHNLFKCIKFFHDLTYKDRKKWVDRSNRCPLCLKSGHEMEDCKAKRVCRFCKGPHNSCIHVEERKSSGKGSKSEAKSKSAIKKDKSAKKKEKTVKKKNFDPKDDSSESDEALVHSVRHDKQKSNVSLTTFVAFIKNPISGQTAKVNALADGGADHSVLSARAARLLGLWEAGGGSDYHVKGHGGSRGCYKAQKFKVGLLGGNGKELREIKVSSYENPCGDLQIEDWDSLKSGWDHLKDLPLPKPVGDGIVDLILGSAALDLMEARKPALFGPSGGPVAKFTSLGWIVGGRTVNRGNLDPDPDPTESRLNFSLAVPKTFADLKLEHECKMAHLQEQYRKKENEIKLNMSMLWGSRECCRNGLRNSFSPARETAEETRARELFEHSYKIDANGRPEVGLMWKNKLRPRNNSELALRLFLSMERQMRNRPGLWEEFVNNVKEWVDNGYARLLSIQRKNEGFFIPTFMVVREDKTTTKFRLIVNGKFQFTGKCINDYLMGGPNVMNKLTDVLIRFRYHKYVLTCDVSHMFLRVGVPPRDRKFLRFFFRDPDGSLKIVEMCSHAFGLTQSPFVVINVVKTHASREGHNFPLAAKAVLEDSIVDDVLTGCKTFDRLKELKREIEMLYEKIKMNVHKWATNSPKLREIIDPNHSATAVDLGQDTESLFCDDHGEIPSIKCLGVLWHPETDMLQFFNDFPSEKGPWTMRKVSSRTSRLFDPLGLVCPLMLEGKLLMQSLWRLGLSWDDAIPDEMGEKYDRWLKKVSFTHLSHIKRRVKAPFRSSEDTLIIFTDASSQAQAAVAYLWSCGQERQEAALWAAKQKISPLNRAESISRLELSGAVLGVELAQQICKAMKWDMNKVLYFTDSTTVLWWLRTHRELDVFVGNRVCRILDSSRLNQWYHVRTAENPADIPTRGMSGKKLASCWLWWQGPEFLRLSRSDWPPQPDVVETRESVEGYRREEKRRIEGWLLTGREADPNPIGLT